MALTVTIYNTTGAAYAFTEILSFQLKKEVYTPYTAFSAQLDTGGLQQFGTICRIVVQYGRNDGANRGMCNGDDDFILWFYQTAAAQ